MTPKCLNYFTSPAAYLNLCKTYLSAQQTTGSGQTVGEEASGDAEREAGEEVQGEPPDPHRRAPDHRVPHQRFVQVWSQRLCWLPGHDAGQDRGAGKN